MDGNHPFPYVGSGIAAARKHMELWVCFRDDVPKAARKAIEAKVPEVVGGYFNWFDRVFVFGHDDDSLQWVVRAAYADAHDEADEHEADDEMPSDAMWKAFNADIDKWLLDVHAKHPVAVFVKPIDEEYSTSTDAWHDWSCERIPTAVLPVVNQLGKKHEPVATYLAQMWRSWALDQPFERQQELVAALTDAARAELRKRKVLFVPKTKPPEPKQPTLDEAEKIWRQCAADLAPMPRGMRLEDAFTAKMIERGFDPSFSLWNHHTALEQAKRTGDAIALGRAAIASGVEFPTHWWTSLADNLLDQRRIEDAADAVTEVVANLESYSAGMLRVAMKWHAAASEPLVEAMLYHAGREWFSSWTSEFTKDQAKKYGVRPPDLSAQFIAWMVRWCGEKYFRELTTLPRIGHWLVWFDKVGKSIAGELASRVEAERDRRVAMRAALEAAPDEATAQALVDQMLAFADPEDASAMFHKIRTNAPLAAYAYLVGTITSEGRNHYRYPRGQRVDAIVCLTYLTLNNPPLASKIEEAYEIGRGYMLVNNASLQFNLACCAARLDRRTDALGHVARSLALDFPNPQQIHDDNDLVPLLGDPAFEQIFVADAARRAAPKPDDDDDVVDERTIKKAKKPVAKKPVAKKPAAKKPAAKKPVAKKPAVKKTAAKTPAAKPAKPAAKKPAAKKLALERPTATRKSKRR
ncbi:MAG: TPR end-of-group domain-containing protein [Kofleriaceae bacterium]